MSQWLTIRLCITLKLGVLSALPVMAQSGQLEAVTRLSDRVVPLLSQVALGVVVGYLVAVLLRRVGKILAFAVIAAFALAQVLAFYDVIDLGPVTAVFDQAIDTVEGEFPSVMDFASANIPAVMGGGLGFFVGLRSGRRRRKDNSK